MPVIKNIASISEILAETSLSPTVSNNKGNLSKKEQFLATLEHRGVDKETVADAIANQFYSSDETIKDKAIERWLKLTEIIKPEGVSQLPTVNILINSCDAINPILMPREISYDS